MAAVSHPHVVKYLGIVYETDEHGNRVYTGFMMERMDCSLLDFMHR